MMTASYQSRGSPWKRGLASGIATTLGGLGHALLLISFPILGRYHDRPDCRLLRALGNRLDTKSPYGNARRSYARPSRSCWVEARVLTAGILIGGA